jgi:DNA-binding NtrC family response regulator
MSHILIVEDDLNHLELLAEIIKFGGHTPWNAMNSEQALKIIQHQNIKLIITDISLNNESGLDFISGLKKEKINIPFIVISGSTNISDRQKAEKLETIAFLKKPIEPEKLLKIIRSI